MIGGIANEVVKQSKITESISKTVEEVAGVAKTNGNSVEQVVSFSEELHSQTEALSQTISEFTLK